MPYAGNALTYHNVAKVERPLFPGCFAAWEPPTCSYLRFSEHTRLYVLAEGFLRPAAHEGVLRERIHSELPLCFGSLVAADLILFSFNAGQSVCFGTSRYSLLLNRVTADW
jgi:hypothetical protein